LVTHPRNRKENPEMTIPHLRLVTFDLMADDDTHFVLTEALREFASRQRWEAEDDPTGDAESRTRWAECADTALDRIEQALAAVPDRSTPSSATPAGPGCEDEARLIAVLIGIWNDSGYPEPLPFEGAHPIPPLGQRTAGHIKAGHGAIGAIGALIRDLQVVRARLVTQMRADEGTRAARRCNACPAPATCSEFGQCTLEQAPAAAALGEALHARLAGLRRDREAWEEAARACVCPPGPCSRGEFRDHAGESEGCMACADLDPEQPCYAAVARRLRAPEEAGR
jgi:hypothetical protein